MASFSGRSNVRRKPLWGRYEVGDDGVVYSGGMPLSAIGGVGVNLGGQRMKICYLVARAFVPNSEGRPYVRHRNGDVRDNRAVNLEWCEEKEERRRGRKPGVRWVKAVRKDGEVEGIWRTVWEASAGSGASRESIRACLAGRQKTAGGLFWEDLVF